MLQLWRNQRLQLRPALPAGTRRRLRRGGERLVICRLNGLLSETAFELSRWRGGRYACDTSEIIGCRSVLNQLSPLFANALFFSLLLAKVDSIPIT